MTTFTPYPHQRAGIKWINEHPAAALFWGMGTGKTVTTLTAVDQLLHDRLEDGPVLVIAPKRVAENTWSKETAKWSTCSTCGSPRSWARPSSARMPWRRPLTSTW